MLHYLQIRGARLPSVDSLRVMHNRLRAHCDNNGPCTIADEHEDSFYFEEDHNGSYLQWYTRTMPPFISLETTKSRLATLNMKRSDKFRPCKTAQKTFLIPTRLSNDTKLSEALTNSSYESFKQHYT